MNRAACIKRLLPLCALAVVFISGCLAEKQQPQNDYTRWAPQELLNEPCTLHVERIERILGPAGGSGEKESAMTTLQHLQWLNHNNSSFFIYLSESANHQIAEEGLCNLQRFSGEGAVQKALIRHCSDPCDRFRDMSLHYLSMVREQAFRSTVLYPRASAMLKDRSEIVRSRAVAVLASIPGKDRVPLLLQKLSDSTPSVRGTALLALASQDLAPQNLKEMSTLLHDPSPFVRACAIHACGESGNRQWAPLIMEAYDDESPACHQAFYDDKSPYCFNAPRYTIRDTVHDAMENLFNRHFDAQCPELKKWWRGFTKTGMM